MRAPSYYKEKASSGWLPWPYSFDLADTVLQAQRGQAKPRICGKEVVSLLWCDRDNLARHQWTPTEGLTTIGTPWFVKVEG